MIKILNPVEAGTDILYHITRVGRLANILTSNQFVLKPGEGTDIEQKLSGGKYYLSTARSTTSSYIQKDIYGGSALLVLNGQKLGQHYKVKPVDYWSTNEKSYEPKIERRVRSYEQEDRVLSNKPVIPNATSYITEVHIMLDGGDEKFNSLFSIKKVCLQHHIPVFFYPKGADKPMLLMDTRKSVQIDFKGKKILPNSGHMEKWDVVDRKYGKSMLAAYLELWLRPVPKQLVGDNDGIYNWAKTNLTKLGFDRFKAITYHDTYDSLNSDMHNAKFNDYGRPSGERESLDKMITILRKNGWSTKQFIEVLRDKWHPPYK